MKGIIISLIGLALLCLCIILEGVDLTVFFNLLSLIYIIPVAIGLFIAFKLSTEPEKVKKYLEIIICSTWLVTFIIICISIVYIITKMDDQDAATLGNGMAYGVSAAFWAGITNIIILLPQYTLASIKISDNSSEGSMSLVNGMSALSTSMIFIGVFFMILFAFSSNVGSTNNDDSTLNVPALSYTIGGTIGVLVYWLVFWLISGLKGNFSKPKLWILSGGTALGFGAICYIIGLVHILSNLGEIDGDQLFKGVSFINGDLAQALAVAVLSVIIAVIVKFMSKNKD